MKKFTPFFFLVLCLCGSKAFSQVKIGDNPTTVNPNSLLELESHSKGLLLPRLSNDQIKAMSGVPTGMLLFSTTDSALYLRQDTGWQVMKLPSPGGNAAWTSNGSGDIYNTNPGKVGIGTSTPYSLLANTSQNENGSDGYGGNPGSFDWSTGTTGYSGLMINTDPSGNSNGMAIKVASADATALDVSRGANQMAGTPLLTVKSTGKVGIGTAMPEATLDVKGDMKVSGDVTIGGNVNLKGNLKVDVIDSVTNATLYAGEFKAFYAGCPTGYKLIGGGGGHRDFNYYQKEMVINYSGPDPLDTNRWRVLMTNLTKTDYLQVQVYAICAKVK